MKKIILTIGTGILFAFTGNAAKLVVQQSGPVGSYGTIVSAITAASNGDTIVINNRIDGLPWQENITVNKSLTFVSAVDNNRFWVDGTYTVEIASGRKVDFMGMRNTSTNTNITVNTTSGAVATRTKINIFNAELSGEVNTSPSISSNVNQVYGTDLYLASSIVNSSVYFSYGKLIGNKIVTGNQNYSVRCYSDLISSNDSIFIIGNDISLGEYISSSNTFSVLSNLNSSQYYYIANNYFYFKNTSFTSYPYTNTNNFYCVILHGKQSANDNLFMNNSIYASLPNSTYGTNNITGLSISNTTENYTVFNNVIYVYAQHAKNPISANSSKCYYNISNQTGSLNPILGNITSSVNFNSDRSNSFTQGTNTGNPLNEYLDLDLTRNDMGCYGGSYSFANFHPIADGKSSRVNFVKTPRIIFQGQTLKVEAVGFDK